MSRSTLSVVWILACAVGVAACGGGDGGGGAGTTRAYVGTQAPGDLWSWTLTTESFSATNETASLTYAGSVTPLPSGFLKLTVTDTTDTTVTPGDAAYAFEVPDSALVVAPAGSDANLIVAVSTSTCPGGPTASFNWVELTRASWDETTDTAYGVAAVTISGATWDVVNSAFLLDGTSAGTETIMGLECTDGIVTDPAAPGAVIALAPTGVFIRDGGPGAGGAMGGSTPASAVSIADVVAAGREYRGFHYEDETVAGADTMPVWARPNGGGGLNGGEYDDIEANIETSDPPAVIAFGTQASPGVVNATLTDGAGTSPILFMINRLGDRYFMFGVSVDTNDGHPYNFVAIEVAP